MHMLVILLTMFDYRMYDRKLQNPRPYGKNPGFAYRIKTLLGVTGARMAKFRSSWRDVILGCLNIVWRPHLMMILWFEALLFGFSIGINVSGCDSLTLIIGAD